MNNPTITDWVVYDLDTDVVIGSWKKYADAEQFWADGLHCMETNWAVFPAVECQPTECGV